MDRLSELPDDILLKILISVPTCSAMRTSVLSKRWRNLAVDMWNGPILNLELVDFLKDTVANVESCMSFFDQVLLRRCNNLPPEQHRDSSEPPRLNRFRLRCEEHHASTVSNYLENFLIRVLRLRTRELDLHLPFNFPNKHVLSIWSEFYTCEQMTTLKIKGFFFEIPPSLPNLKALYISVGGDAYVNVDGYEVTGVTSFSQYPKLETLSIKGHIASNMEFVLPDLKYLKLGFNHLSDNRIVIDAPLLKELEIVENQEGEYGNYLVRGTSALEDATFSFKILHAKREYIDIIELTPRAREATKKWLRDYHHLECVEFVRSDTKFVFGDGTELNLVLTLCEEERLHLLRNTVIDLRLINLVTDHQVIGEGNCYVLPDASTKFFEGDEMCIRVACRQILHLDRPCRGDSRENPADVSDDGNSFSD